MNTLGICIHSLKNVPGTLPIFNIYIFFTVEVLINLNVNPYHMYDLHTFFLFCSVIILALIYFIYRHYYSLLGLLYSYDLGLFVLCSISLLTFCMMLTTDCGIEDLSYAYSTAKCFTQIPLTD